MFKLNSFRLSLLASLSAFLLSACISTPVESALKQKLQPSITPNPTSTPSPATGPSEALSVAALDDAVDFAGPGRGAEIWHNTTSESVSYPSTSGVTSYDLYYRFTWADIETGNGVYNWVFFDSLVKRAIDAGQKFAFGVMTACPGGCLNTISYGGAISAYPKYLHDLMQAESPKDWISHLDDANWVPNWNSPSFLSNFERLMTAINQHLETTSYNGVRFKHVIHYIDIRGFGAWGEWHSGDIVNDTNEYPAGTYATAASLKRIADAHINAFRDYQLVCLMAVFSAGWDYIPIFRIPAEVGQYFLTARTNVGLIGWRRDNWGATDSYLHEILERNSLWKNEILSRYKYAPVNGEPMPGGTAIGGNCAYWDLKSQVELYHAAFFGNENYAGQAGTDCAKQNIRASFRASGYRIVIRGGTRTSIIGADRKLTVRLDWQNIGVAPSYENWDTFLELRNSGGAVVWSGKSNHIMRLFNPQVDAAGKVIKTSAPTPVTDTFVLPNSLPAGSYTLQVIVKDPNGYRKPFPLAISGRGSDGAYALGTVKI